MRTSKCKCISTPGAVTDSGVPESPDEAYELTGADAGSDSNAVRDAGEVAVARDDAVTVVDPDLHTPEAVERLSICVSLADGSS